MTALLWSFTVATTVVWFLLALGLYQTGKPGWIPPFIFGCWGLASLLY